MKSVLPTSSPVAKDDESFNFFTYRTHLKSPRDTLKGSTGSGHKLYPERTEESINTLIQKTKLTLARIIDQGVTPSLVYTKPTTAYDYSKRKKSLASPQESKGKASSHFQKKYRSPSIPSMQSSDFKQIETEEGDMANLVPTYIAMTPKALDFHRGPRVSTALTERNFLQHRLSKAMSSCTLHTEPDQRKDLLSSVDLRQSLKTESNFTQPHDQPMSYDHLQLGPKHRRTNTKSPPEEKLLDFLLSQSPTNNKKVVKPVQPISNIFCRSQIAPIKLKKFQQDLYTTKQFMTAKLLGPNSQKYNDEF